MPALEAVYEVGADGVVVDLELTRDGVLVACEDRLLRASSAAFAGVADATYAQLQALDGGIGFAPLHQRTPIPRLDQVLSAFGRRCEVWVCPPLILSSTRADAFAVALGEVARAYDADVTLLSEDFEILEAIREVNAGVKRVYRPLDASFEIEGSARLLACVDGLAFGAAHLYPEQAEQAQRHGKATVAVDCDTPNAAIRALRTSVDAVVTERPGWLLDWFDYMRQRPGPGSYARISP